jgi:hypothetical protein
MLNVLKGLLIFVGGIVVLMVIVGIVGVAAVSSETGGGIRSELHHAGGRAIASDLIEQYDFLRKNGGSPMEVCMQAGAVAMAYMHADDSTKYKAWKSAQHRDCARAGIDL